MMMNHRTLKMLLKSGARPSVREKTPQKILPLAKRGQNKKVQQRPNNRKDLLNRKKNLVRTKSSHRRRGQRPSRNSHRKRELCILMQRSLSSNIILLMKSLSSHKRQQITRKSLKCHQRQYLKQNLMNIWKCICLECLRRNFRSNFIHESNSTEN